MSWDTSSVSIGESTKKSAYDRIMNNIIEIASNTFNFYAQKTFNSGTVFEVRPTFKTNQLFTATVTFDDNIHAGTILSNSGTTGVAIEVKKTLAAATATTVNTKTKILEIGTWDMNSTVTKQVAHGLGNPGYKKIRSINIIIRKDDDVDYYAFFSYGLHTAYLNATNIVMIRDATSIFDNVNFDTMGDDGNRGWIILIYEI